MKTREKGYKDYGFYEEDEHKKIIKYCRSSDFDEDDSFLLNQAALHIKPCIQNELYESIVTGISYEKLTRKKYIPLPEGDFYGYRRKCIEEFWRLMRISNKWK